MLLPPKVTLIGEEYNLSAFVVQFAKLGMDSLPRETIFRRFWNYPQRQSTPLQRETVLSLRFPHSAGSKLDSAAYRGIMPNCGYFVDGAIIHSSQVDLS